MRKALCKVTSEVVAQAVEDLRDGKRILTIPDHERPIYLNDINIVAYSLLSNSLFEMKPKELQFAAQMARAVSITIKQRKWLKAIAQEYLDLDIDTPVGNVTKFAA